MSCFVAQVAGVSPLQIQIGAKVQDTIAQDGGPGFRNITAAGQLVELEASSAISEAGGFSGEASRPFFFIPETPGYVTDGTLVRFGQSLSGIKIVRQNGQETTASSRAGWLADFSVAPTTPDVSTSANNLPIRARWLFPPRSGFLFPEFLVFYAGSAAGHNWNGRVVWEER